ncbi:hypothetical protein EDD21DRAFT_206012 [Dissophora ornata]|nr:hypothetical protein EDD21DRAFT_206012 [Dissophora ornata]
MAMQVGLFLGRTRAHAWHTGVEPQVIKNTLGSSSFHQRCVLLLIGCRICCPLSLECPFFALPPKKQTLSSVTTFLFVEWLLPMMGISVSIANSS